MFEEIGWHNTFNKFQFEYYVRKLSTRDRLVLTSGRSSSKKLLKALKMQALGITTRHSAKEHALSFVRYLGITLVGYAHESRLSVYFYPEPLGGSTRGVR